MYNKYSVKKFVEARGEREIRTPVRVSSKHAFQACTLSHSDTSPKKQNISQKIMSLKKAIQEIKRLNLKI